MINLLSARDKRYLDILESLFDSDSLTLDDLAVITRSSKRTVQNDIQGLNSCVAPLEITTSHKTGCSLIIPNNYSIDYVYQLILNQSIEYQLLEAVFFLKHESMEACSEALFISTSSLKRLIKRINQRIVPLGFKVVTAPLDLVGDEELICQLLENYLGEKYQSDEYPFTKAQLDVVDKLIELIAPHNYRVYQTMDYLKRKLLVRILRLKRNISKNICIEATVDLSYFFSECDHKRLVLEFKNAFGFILDNESWNFLLKDFITTQILTSIEEMEEVRLSNDIIRKKISKLEKICELVSIELDIPLINKKEMLLELYNETEVRRKNEFFIFDRQKRFLKLFAKENPDVYAQLVNLPVLKEQIDKKKFLDVIYTILTKWENLYHEIKKKDAEIKVGVLMDFDFNYSTFITSVLREHFNKRINFENIVIEDIGTLAAAQSKFNFIVTNISHIDLLKIPIVCTNLYPDETDFNKIKACILSVSEVAI